MLKNLQNSKQAKSSFFLLGLLLTFLFGSGKAAGQNQLTFGANYVHRFMQTYNDFGYPRLAVEYSISRSSSFEFLAEYINLRKSHGIKTLSYPLSAGYKLNYIPLFTKNEWLISNLKVYTSLRYTMILTNRNITSHQLRFAPGIDIFLNKNWGLNSEIVLGNNLRTTMAFGIKYRFKK